GQQHQSVRRGVWIWGLSRKRFRARRRQRRFARIFGAGVVQKCACNCCSFDDRKWSAGGGQSVERNRPHREALHWRKTGEAGFGIQRTGVWKCGCIVGRSAAWQSKRRTQRGGGRAQGRRLGKNAGTQSSASAVLHRGEPFATRRRNSQASRSGSGREAGG